MDLVQLVFNVYGIIYKITNLINKKIYIGQTVKYLEERWYEHIRWAENNDLFYHLYNSIRKYGIDNFKIEELLKCFNLEDLNFFEDYYIIVYDAMNRKKGYNKMKGGWGFHKFSDEVILRRTESLKKYLSNPDNKNKLVERNRKISNTMNNIWRNDEKYRNNWTNKMKKWWLNPENKEKHKKATKEGMNKPEIKEKIRKRMKILSDNPEIKERFKKRMEKYWSNPENRKKHSERMKEYYTKKKKEAKNKGK